MFRMICLIDFFDELVLQDGFIHNVPDPQDDFEGNAIFTQFVIAHEWLEPSDAVLAFIQDCPGDSQRHVFYMLQVVAVGDGDRNENRTFCQGLFIIGQGGSGNAFIGNDDHISRTGTDGRIALVHIDDPAGFPACQTDVIADMHLFGDQCRNAGEQIG